PRGGVARRPHRPRYAGRHRRAAPAGLRLGRGVPGGGGHGPRPGAAHPAALGRHGRPRQGGAGDHSRGAGADARDQRALPRDGAAPRARRVPPTLAARAALRQHPRRTEPPMSVSQESRPAPAGMPDLNLMTPIDRRSDVEAKQAVVAGLLKDAGCDGLLVLQPENFAWLTAGAAARGILDPGTMPALYFSAEGRWLLSSNVDTQRIFDEEIDGLGFQLKEWPWHWGRTQLLADLCQGRNVGCDSPLEGCHPLGDRLAKLRLSLSEYERACYRALGQVLAHAIEATGRTLAQGDTEREIAGQISHRLLHRGVYPLSIAVAADGRSRNYRQPSFTSTQVQRYCVLTVTARKYGLCASASRSVCFGQPDAQFRREHDAACKVSATYVASSWPDSVPRQILTSGQRIYQLTGAEHEF